MSPIFEGIEAQPPTEAQASAFCGQVTLNVSEDEHGFLGVFGKAAQPSCGRAEGRVAVPPFHDLHIVPAQPRRKTIRDQTREPLAEIGDGSAVHVLDKSKISDPAVTSSGRGAHVQRAGNPSPGSRDELPFPYCGSTQPRDASPLEQNTVIGPLWR
jgi:hypothetical protein